jgi:DNA-binding MarR family transcriptional regulator
MAKRLMVAPTVLTGIVDRLERRGYIRRENDPTDRRKLRLMLSEEGRRISMIVEDALIAEVAVEISQLSSEELVVLDGGLTLLGRIFHGLETKSPTEQ